VADFHSLSRLYWDFFLTAFFALALWESFQPRRDRVWPVGRRWSHHGALAAIGNLVGLLFRTSPLLVSVAVATSPYGLLNHAGVPLWIRAIFCVCLLDATRYVQHRLLHSSRVLWRLHQVHHSDEDFDLTTGLRFHPVEAVVTQGSYLIVVAILAPPLEAVVASEFATVAQNFFSHANVRIPAAIERPLRRILITPEMHRVHHSVDVDEQNTNFGTILPFWDRMFGTYLAEPAAGPDGVRFGLRDLQPGTRLTLAKLLTMPFVRQDSRVEPPAPKTSSRDHASSDPAG
jgi:sterol desaturase/sphingolipid hydroxylase (fatty acid hydroxylase superfamily)